MIGTDFPYQQFYPKDADRLFKLMSVENNWAGATKSRLRLYWRCRRQPLARFCQNWTRTSPENAFADLGLNIIERHARAVDETGNRRAKASKPIQFLNILRECSTSSATKDAIFSWRLWAPRRSGQPATLTMNGRRRILGSFNHGSMANGSPAGYRGAGESSWAVRVNFRFRGERRFSRCSWAICFSLRQLQLPVKVIVFKNDALAFCGIGNGKRAGHRRFLATGPGQTQISQKMGRGPRVSLGSRPKKHRIR